MVDCFMPVPLHCLAFLFALQRSFTPNERIGWSHIRIPESVMNGETVEESYPLSGKQGDDKEGTINLVLSLTVSP